MDELSIAITQLESYPLTAASLFFHHATYLLLALITLYLAWHRRRVGIKLLLTYLLLIVLVPTLKVLIASERACELAKIECPDDAAFPSGHAAASAAMLGAATFTAYFAPALLFHIAVALSRVYLGVHSLTDVIGGTVVGLAVYFMVSQFWDEHVKRKVKKRKT